MSPWVEERALAFAIHVIRWFGEYTSTGCLGASKEFLDRRDTKCDGGRPGALLCRRSGVSVYAGFGDDDGPIAVQELPAILGVAETFGEWKGRCEPRDCFGHVGVVKHGDYGAVWCRAVLLQHRLGGYHSFPGRLTTIRRKAVSPISAFVWGEQRIKGKRVFSLTGPLWTSTNLNCSIRFDNVIAHLWFL